MISIKNKLLVIFLFAIILTIIIYEKNYKISDNILLLGNYENFYDIESKDNVYKFLYKKISYKELNNCIIHNDYIIIKNKSIYLNQLVSRANIIIIDISNKNRKNNIYVNKLVNTLRKINNGKIIIIDYNFDNYEENGVIFIKKTNQEYVKTIIKREMDLIF